MGNLKLESFHLTSKYGKLHANAVGHAFNGTDDFIDLPSHWGGSNWKTLTVEAWINPSANTGDFQAILSPKDTSFIHFQLHNKGVGNITIYTDQGGVTLPVIPVEPLNQWRHVAVIAESGNSNLLIDGQQYGATNTKEFNYILPTDDLFIGRGYQRGRHFKGKIGNVHIWQDARPQEDIHGDLYQFMTDKPEFQGSTPDPTPVTTKFGYKSYHGKYMSAQPNGTMECNRDHLRGWETFTVEDAGNGKVGLKSYHGKYVSAQPNGTITCDRDWLRGWEMFTIENSGGKVGLKSFHGKYISAQPNGTITCDRDWLRGWELFTKEGV